MLPTAVYCLLALLSTLADRQRPLRLLESSGIIKVIAGPFRFPSKQSHFQRTNKQYRHYELLRTSNTTDKQVVCDLLSTRVDEIFYY